MKKYLMKDNRDGSEAVYETSVGISETDTEITFAFDAKHSGFYCPYHEYNEIHSCGDAVEVLIGTDPERGKYYEIEVSPENGKMLALMRYLGTDGEGKVKLDIGFIDESKCFFRSSVTRTSNGYVAVITINKDEAGLSGDGVYFNAYRLETDGGEQEKHLFAINPTMCGKFHVPSKYVYLKDFV